MQLADLFSLAEHVEVLDTQCWSSQGPTSKQTAPRRFRIPRHPIPFMLLVTAGEWRLVQIRVFFSSQDKGTTCFICVSRPAHALISASGEKKKTKKFQRKCVPPDKFAWTSTVLDRRRERDRLLDANNSIMETDREGKFVSQSCSWQYIALQSESRSRRSRLPCLSLLLEHWSS